MHEKLCIGDIVSLDGSMQERRHGISFAAAEHVDLK